MSVSLQHQLSPRHPIPESRVSLARFNALPEAHQSRVRRLTSSRLASLWSIVDSTESVSLQSVRIVCSLPQRASFVSLAHQSHKKPVMMRAKKTQYSLSQTMHFSHVEQKQFGISLGSSRLVTELDGKRYLGVTPDLMLVSDKPNTTSSAGSPIDADKRSIQNPPPNDEGGPPVVAIQTDSDTSPQPVGILPRVSEACNSLGEAFRAIRFFTLVVIVSVIVFVAMLVCLPFVLLLDKDRRTFDHIGCFWATVTTWPFFKTKVRGPGAANAPVPNLPAGPCIYVANHQSWLDPFALYRSGLWFKMLIRTDVAFKLPLFGLALRWMKQIPVDPRDKQKNKQAIQDCKDLLRQGVPLVFFAEGQVSQDRRLMKFKDGAFKTAVELQIPIVPVTLVGTGRLMPASRELNMRKDGSFGIDGITVVVHDPILPGETDPHRLKAKVHSIIESALPSEKEEAAFDRYIEEQQAGRSRGRSRSPAGSSAR